MGFYQAVARLRSSGYDPSVVHIQSSYGLLNLPALPVSARWNPSLQRADDGSPTATWPDLRPVLSLWARVASAWRLAPGEGAGYGLTFQAKYETVLAVVTIGYRDRLPR